MGKSILLYKQAFSENVVLPPRPLYEGYTMKDMKDYFEQMSGGCCPSLDSIAKTGTVRANGWIYVFDLPKFLAKQYGEWSEYYAPNKTLLRKYLRGKVEKIIALDD